MAAVTVCAPTRPENFTMTDLCRICANYDNHFMPIYVGDGLEHTIFEKICRYLPIIKVSKNDLLPPHICYQCASLLISWHELYKNCIEADKFLRSLLKPGEDQQQPTTEIEKEEKQSDRDSSVSPPPADNADDSYDMFDPDIIVTEETKLSEPSTSASGSSHFLNTGTGEEFCLDTIVTNYNMDTVITKMLDSINNSEDDVELLDISAIKRLIEGDETLIDQIEDSSYFAAENSVKHLIKGDETIIDQIEDSSYFAAENSVKHLIKGDETLIDQMEEHSSYFAAENSVKRLIEGDETLIDQMEEHSSYIAAENSVKRLIEGDETLIEQIKKRPSNIATESSQLIKSSNVSLTSKLYKVNSSKLLTGKLMLHAGNNKLIFNDVLGTNKCNGMPENGLISGMDSISNSDNVEKISNVESIISRTVFPEIECANNNSFISGLDSVNRSKITSERYLLTGVTNEIDSQKHLEGNDIDLANLDNLISSLRLNSDNVPANGMPRKILPDVVPTENCKNLIEIACNNVNIFDDSAKKQSVIVTDKQRPFDIENKIAVKEIGNPVNLDSFHSGMELLTKSSKKVVIASGDNKLCAIKRKEMDCDNLSLKEIDRILSCDNESKPDNVRPPILNRKKILGNKYSIAREKNRIPPNAKLIESKRRLEGSEKVCESILKELKLPIKQNESVLESLSATDTDDNNVPVKTESFISEGKLNSQKQKHMCVRCKTLFTTEECLNIHTFIEHSDQHNKYEISQGKSQTKTSAEKCKSTERKIILPIVKPSSIAEGRTFHHKYLSCGQEDRTDSSDVSSFKYSGRKKKRDVNVRSFQTQRDTCSSTYKECLYKCDKCTYAAKDMTHFLQHIRKHTIAHHEQCRHCGLKFSTKPNLGRHIELEHSSFHRVPPEKRYSGRWKMRDPQKSHATIEGESFSCMKCGKVFKHRLSLMVHKKRKHDMKVRLFRCDECFKLFSDCKELLQHREIHVAQGAGGSLNKRKRHEAVHSQQANSSDAVVCKYCRIRIAPELLIQHYSTYHSMLYTATID